MQHRKKKQKTDKNKCIYNNQKIKFATTTTSVSIWYNPALQFFFVQTIHTNNPDVSTLFVCRCILYILVKKGVFFVVVVVFKDYVWRRKSHVYGEGGGGEHTWVQCHQQCLSGPRWRFPASPAWHSSPSPSWSTPPRDPPEATPEIDHKKLKVFSCI